MIDPCNLFVKAGFRGYDQMVRAAQNGGLGRAARRQVEKHGGGFNPHDWYRYDHERGGIHVNYNDYIEIVGLVGAGEVTKRETFKRFTDDQLRAIYTPTKG